MHSMFAPTKRHAGFTLVEVLIISPLVILVVALIVAVMVGMAGTALQTRERNNLTYDMQEGLNQIESDIRLATRVVDATGTLATGQGSNNNFTGTAAFSTSAVVLVLEQYSTSKSPLDPARTLLYYSSPNACDSSQRHLNPTLQHQVIFFLDDGTLKRRTIVDFAADTVCDSGTTDTLASVNSPGIWQRNSCKTTDTSRCFSLDTIIARNISSVNFLYYDSSSDTTPSAPSDTTASIRTTITGAKPVAGDTITHTASLRASRIE